MRHWKLRGWALLIMLLVFSVSLSLFGRASNYNLGQAVSGGRVQHQQEAEPASQPEAGPDPQEDRESSRGNAASFLERGQNAPPYPAYDTGDLVLGLVLYDTADPFDAMLWDWMEDWDQGAELTVMNAGGDFAMQYVMIEDLILRSANCIAFTSGDVQALVPIVQATRDAGVYTIHISFTGEPCEAADVNILYDQFSAGTHISELISVFSLQHNILYLQFHDNQALTQGINDYFAEDETFHLTSISFAGNNPSDPGVVSGALESFLSSFHRPLSLVVLDDAALTKLVRESLDALELWDVQLCALGTADALRQLTDAGTLQFFAGLYPDEVGSELANTLLALCHGEAVPPVLGRHYMYGINDPRSPAA